MDEPPKQDLPLENGEIITTDADIISLPRRTIGTPEIVAGFLMLLSLYFLADFVWKVWGIMRVSSSFTEGAGMHYSAILAGMVFSLAAGLALASGAIGLVFFIGFGRSWAMWTVCLLPALLLLKIPAIYFSTSVFEKPPADMFIKVVMFVWIAFTVCWLLSYVPRVRDFSPGARETFSRRSVSKICALAVCLGLWFVPEWVKFSKRQIGVNFSIFKMDINPAFDQNYLFIIGLLAVAVVFFFIIDLVFGFKHGLVFSLLLAFVLIMEYFINSGKYSTFAQPNIQWFELVSGLVLDYLPVPFIAIVGLLYGFRRRRIAAAVMAGILIIAIITVRIEVALFALSAYRNNATLWLWILVTVPSFLVCLYPLVVLMILPLRPLGKELFKRNSASKLAG